MFTQKKKTISSSGSKISPLFGHLGGSGREFSVCSFFLEHFLTIQKIGPSLYERISLYDQNCGQLIFRYTALFLLATRVLPASPNFGQAKHGQNGLAATDCQQCICCPICGHHFTHWTHPDI